MKIKYIIPALFALLLGVNSCDKDFVEINTNPIAITDVDPILQLARAQYELMPSDLHYQGPIVQQIITPYGGVLEGGNRNTYIDNNSNAAFNDLYNNSLKDLTDILLKLEGNADKTNLYSMARICRAYAYMWLVDCYGDVPYSEANKGYTDNTFLPKYDDQKTIYEDILKELKEATDALDASKDAVKGEIFYKGDIAKWKKLGNSLLLRAGMRYTKYDNAKASSTVADAVNPSRGGVISSNSDNVFYQFNDTYTYGLGNTLNGGERQNYYLGAPFVNYLKVTNDPRITTIAVLYQFPGGTVSPTSSTVGTTNTNPADQIGMPYGYDESSILTAPGYPGKNGAAFLYSQLNRSTVASIVGKEYLITCSQTQLLLAEARERGYISTGTVQGYYEAGVRAHMTQPPYNVSVADQDVFLAGPAAFVPANALQLINEQYWVSSFMMWNEAWANFRRSGYPALAPNGFPGADPAVGTTGFIHKLPYPDREYSVNPTNAEAAKANMGSDNLSTRVFWDKI
ncbi:MAG TPA: SusD/RagB family nutrient-binding outer membrane lipoprotein [Bacteroidales bacterium]|nr:SusD/RagB family nutrient-binding outer membrane lipoprotein [Bacteroidales bacterium]